MPIRPFPRTALFCCWIAAGCASPAPSPAGAPTMDNRAASSRPRSPRDVLTTEEIRAAVGAADAYSLIQKLRPSWLRMRGDPNVADSDGSVAIQVYYNGRHAGTVAVLREYEVSQLVSIRWLDPIAARSSYGARHGRGVIAIEGR